MSTTETETTLPPDKREALRAELFADIPGWYSPWGHLLFPSLVGLSLMAASLAALRGLRAIELLTVPVTFVFSNMTEWRAHKDLLHKRFRPLAVLYDRHTPQHHRIFVRDDMSVRSPREWRLVLIPSFGIVAIFAATLPLTALLYLVLGLRNVAALFVCTTMGYVVSYEWLHLSYHLPPESFVGRLWLVRVLRRHHATHHEPALMRKWNFNVTIPLWDWVRGTIYRGPLRAK